MGEKYMQEEFLGEEFLGEKYIGEKYMGEVSGLKSLGEYRDRWDAGFRSTLLRLIFMPLTLAQTIFRGSFLTNSEGF